MGDMERPAEPPFGEILRAIRARTPARILVGRSGTSYRTSTQLDLRVDHAAALDAVHAEVDLVRDLGQEFVNRWGLFEVSSLAGSKAEYLARPDLGRKLSPEGREAIDRECPPGADLQVVIGDGLSAAAVRARIPSILPLLERESHRLGWRLGRPFLVRGCRVGLMNDVGDCLKPEVVVLLIGERPGLATAESLSAYMAYRPGLGQTDANRNLVANIHERGVPDEEAVSRIIRLALSMRRAGSSGVAIKEEREEMEDRLSSNSPETSPTGQDEST
ncbi:ethanolamine ammonia-lyase subunit EutC [Tundrisphaera lichenicola]|uniref:ethanolamine ammonia-lyase subunit EutC n=1 Tax=Tundrisphaera lichenicola TaxID=2029860 RepID=UPI003EBE8DF5